ncbi:pseudouridine synthase [Aspergillus terreus]|uniref:Pseudouridine synthase n=1 Tax=Aspergillus terreus TaxID=33178 RepID=A0A5M3YVQ6_ASPTE|nr:hypothetical protein ATETN484_0004040000 [Aspergillus terreus]GFF13289.1 pseudouridine synthase [Aspergillus terreus]
MAPGMSIEEPVVPGRPLPEPYYFEHGLRRVKPYYWEYHTYCKQRWRGRELVDIFTSEFRDRPEEYYKTSLAEGKVKVDGKVAGPHRILKNGEKLQHTLHRHEPPVTGLPIGIIHEDDDLLVIDKPAGVPVHAAGRYHYNSIIEILRNENGVEWMPRPCNRLDRLTSGVMFIGKTAKGAEKMCAKLQQRTVQKEYIARVKGRFPDGVVICDQPIMQVSPKLGLNRVRATGKDAKTKFRRIAYYPPAAPAAGEGESQGEGEERAATPPPALANEDEGYSIVHCLPLTGRTHQIRVHLQFLGHPITNDPIYSNRRVFGEELGKNDSSGERDEEIMEKLSAMGKTEVAEVLDATSYRTLITTPPAVPPGTSTTTMEMIMSREHEAAVEAYHKRKGERLSGETCPDCGTELYTDPGVHELGIFLHAVAYADTQGDWKYRSKMPSWGLPPKGFDGPREAPDWVPVPESEEVVIGCGAVPEGMEEEDDGRKKNAPVLLRGVGMVDLSAYENGVETASA